MSKPKANTRLIGRIAGFYVCTAAIWAAYIAWRPPAPILNLRIVEHWPETSNRVSLSFDDGPHPLTTPLLLATMQRAQVKASFFVVGDGMRLYPELANRIVQQGHKLANHSQYHHNLTTIAPDEFSHEVQSCFDLIQSHGQQTTLFRPPGGGLNRDAMNYLYENNVTLAWWSNNVGDWTRPPAWKITREVTANLRAGDFILLHDAGVCTPQALPDIIRIARKRGLEFHPMPEPHEIKTP